MLVHTLSSCKPMRSYTLLAPLLCLATGLSAQVSYFTATLDSAQEVPPNASTARGWGIVRFDAATNGVRIVVRAEGLTGVAAHLHTGVVGANGPVTVGLTFNGSEWTGAGTLSAANAAALLAAGTYLNVHTAANPGGEIRGQVVVPTTTRMTTVLSGANEVPPNGSTATGEAVAFLHEPDNRISYVVNTNGLVNVVAAHIHIGPAGANGPVIHNLMGGAGNYCGVSDRLTAAQLTAAKADGLYFNVHTAALPGGEVRGQLEVNVGDFVAAMDGTQEVPPNASTAFGSTCGVVNPNKTISYLMTTAGMTGVAAHYHRAPAGSNGPVVVGFSGGPSVWSGTSVALTAANLADLRGGLWYANAHSAAFPGGEVRGQVRTATLPTTYGAACANSGGGRSNIGSNGAPCLGSTFDVTLRGATPTVPAVFSLGASRDSVLGLPLPFELTIASAPGCYLYHDLLLTFATATDTRGCANFGVPIPLSPSLRGSHFYFQWFMIDGGLKSSNALDALLQ